jgi:hypothetical protein
MSHLVLAQLQQQHPGPTTPVTKDATEAGAVYAKGRA